MEDSSTYESVFIKAHEMQLKANAIPPTLYTTLAHKIRSNCFDASYKFGIEQYEDGKRNCVVTAEEGVKPYESIYLIDHAFSFPNEEASGLRANLSMLPDEVLQRLAGIMAVPAYTENEDEDVIQRPKEDIVDDMVSEIWRYIGCYSVGGKWIWYLNDEVGSSINHSSEGGVVCVPFIHMHIDLVDGKFQLTGDMTPYTIMWPIAQLNTGDSVERDFCSWVSTPIERVARLVDWLGEDVMDDELVQQLVSGAEHHESVLGDISESLSVPSAPTHPPLPPLIEPSSENGYVDKLRVYTPEDDSLRLLHPTGGLTHPAFVMTSVPEEADILWYSEPLKTTPEAWTEDQNAPLSLARPMQLLNQFPYEGAFLIKAHLAREVARCVGRPNWWKSSYDLQTHLPVYVGEYLRQRRAKQESSSESSPSSNVWILKPSIGTRSQGHVITNSLIHAIRLLEVDSNRVAQKFVERPLLWKGSKKFDMRFIVCVRSCSPVELYVYNAFWTRVSNKPYCSNGHENVWEDNQKALTAMWVLDGVEQDGQLPDCEEVVAGIRELYPLLNWSDILMDIHKMLRELFHGVSSKQPNGMACKRARALYGCDVILEAVEGEGNSVTKVEPKLLEVTFVPSNSAVNPLFSKQYPSYVNDVFGCLFLGETNNLTRLL